MLYDTIFGPINTILVKVLDIIKRVKEKSHFVNKKENRIQLSHVFMLHSVLH